jgi:hypothetical protein
MTLSEEDLDKKNFRSTLDQYSPILERMLMSEELKAEVKSRPRKNKIKPKATQ